MIRRLRARITYSNVIASIALFIALGGAAVAAGLPRNSVGPNQIKRGAVNAAKLKRGAVTSSKIAAKAVTAGKLGPSSVTPGNIGNGAVTTSKLAAGSVIASTIKNGVVTTNKLTNNAVTAEKLANEAVTSAKLGKDSVTAAKLSPELGPLLGTLKPGQTLRGVFDVGGTAHENEDLARAAVSFQFPLLNPPAVTILKPGETSPNCAGLGGGQTPAANAGNLCLYVTAEANLAKTSPLEIENNTRLGFGLKAKADEGDAAGKEFHALGMWAVTAP